MFLLDLIAIGLVIVFIKTLIRDKIETISCRRSKVFLSILPTGAVQGL